MSNIEQNYTAAPAMTEEEISCLACNLPSTEGTGQPGAVLEFGLGGSTRFMFEQGIFRLYAVDDSKEWIESVKSETFFDFFIRKKRLFLHHADIGPCEAWGHPSSVPNPAWLGYHQAIWEHIDGEDGEKKIDFVLIDGRFRIAAACQSILHCHPGLRIFIHDFWTRPAYHCLLDFLEVKDKAGSAAVLTLKNAQPDWRKIALTLQKYQFDIR